MDRASAAFKLTAEQQAKLRDRELISKHALSGKCLREIIGYTEDQMQLLYKAARQILEKERYADAADAFIYLVSIDPYKHAYWQGLGMAEQAQGNFTEALEAYSMAVLVNFQEPAPHFYCGKCYYALNQFSHALASLDLAIAFSGDHPKHEKTRRLAEESKDFLVKAHRSQITAKGAEDHG